MKQLWFDSSKFQPIQGEDEKTNPGRLGLALATWVKQQLNTTEEPIPEDWGWVVMVHRAPFPLWIGCGNEDGSTTRWSVFVEAEPGLMQRLFKRVNSAPAVAALEQRLETLLKSEPHVQNVSWESN